MEITSFTTQETDELFDVILSINLTDSEKENYSIDDISVNGWVAPTAWVSFIKETGKFHSISLADEGFPTKYDSVLDNIQKEHIKQIESYVEGVKGNINFPISL